MRLGKWVLGLAVLSLLLGGVADAQTIAANKLCIHNGGDYYTNGPFHGYPNQGGGRYFPSFAHWPGTPKTECNPGDGYPWKIAGWAWTGMQANAAADTWYWETILMGSLDNPYAATMSYDYPQLFCTGAVPHTGFPMPIYGGTVPPVVPLPSNPLGFVFPSSAGGFDPYLNIFALGAASWNTPGVQPYYGWSFAFSLDCASAITLPSAYSIYQFAWQQLGPNDQYIIGSGNEIDCLGGGGNKGRNYTLVGDFDNGQLWAWLNTCAGTDGLDWSMCIFVCDAVCVPYNVPGAPNASNPFLAYGFDVGTPTLMPYLSSNCLILGFMVEAFDQAPCTSYGILASFGFGPGIPYGKKCYRIRGWDPLTNLFLNLIGIFLTHVDEPYPACMFGTTRGGHSIGLPFPANPALVCAEIWYWAFAGGAIPPSAAYKVTYF